MDRDSEVRATALLADVRLPPEYWSYACRWVAYVHTHRVTEIPINKALPHFGDVVVIHHAFKKPPSFENRGSTGVCLGHDTRIAGGVLVVSVINGELKEVCSAKVRKLGERVGQAWRLHVHPQDSSRAAYVNRKGEVRWNLQDLEVPTVEQCVKEDALEIQDIRELGLGWRARDAVVERYQRDGPENNTYLASEMLTNDEMLARAADQPEIAYSLVAPASMPPPTCLVKGKTAEALSQVHAVTLKDTSLKLYHVMSVKQTLREDLAECAYQFSCRAADWSRSDMHAVPMQFEPLELHVIDALGQQEVPDYFQQPAKAITEDVSVMRGPHAQEWIAAVLEEIESFKRLGVYEEVPKEDATSHPLPARLILVTKPNIHGGPARKKARIVICGNFQDVHPDEFIASKTPS